jgi:hypothetical protein
MTPSAGATCFIMMLSDAMVLFALQKVSVEDHAATADTLAGTLTE